MLGTYTLNSRMLLEVCAISGTAPEQPVYSPKTGSDDVVAVAPYHRRSLRHVVFGDLKRQVYERRLIEKQVQETGRCPVTQQELTQA